MKHEEKLEEVCKVSCGEYPIADSCRSRRGWCKITFENGREAGLKEREILDMDTLAEAHEKGRKAEQERILEKLENVFMDRLGEEGIIELDAEGCNEILKLLREGGIGTVGSDKEIEKLIKKEAVE